MAFAVFTTVTAVAMLGPLLVDMSSALDTTVPVVGQLVTISAASWAISALLVGPFSDTYGRKPVLVLGSLLVAVASLGTGLAPNFAIAAALRVLAGIGGGMVPPTCVALVGDIFPERRRPMSVATITMQPGLSSVLGVPLSAVLGGFAGWRFPFFAVGLALFLAALLLFILAPHHRPQTTSLELGRRLRRVVTFPVTWHMAGANLVARMAFGVIITFLPAFLILTYDLRTAEVALPMAIVAVGATLAPLLGGRIGGGRRRLTIVAAALLAATIPGLAIFLQGWGMWLSVFSAGFFMLLIIPVTTILMIVVAEVGGASRGTLAGVLSSSNWGGTAIGAAIGGILVAQVGYGSL
ncbi:MAG: MFS transporter, partial [Dehalococcoidia bacterium]|nr:MFS transporter [Dehalococcoidia bacterium]